MVIADRVERSERVPLHVQRREWYPHHNREGAAGLALAVSAVTGCLGDRLGVDRVRDGATQTVPGEWCRRAAHRSEDPTAIRSRTAAQNGVSAGDHSVTWTSRGAS